MAILEYLHHIHMGPGQLPHGYPGVSAPHTHGSWTVTSWQSWSICTTYTWVLDSYLMAILEYLHYIHIGPGQLPHGNPGVSVPHTQRSWRVTSWQSWSICTTYTWVLDSYPMAILEYQYHRTHVSDTTMATVTNPEYLHHIHMGPGQLPHGNPGVSVPHTHGSWIVTPGQSWSICTTYTWVLDSYPMAILEYLHYIHMGPGQLPHGNVGVSEPHSHESWTVTPWQSCSICTTYTWVLDS